MSVLLARARQLLAAILRRLRAIRLAIPADTAVSEEAPPRGGPCNAMRTRAILIVVLFVVAVVGLYPPATERLTRQSADDLYRPGRVFLFAPADIKWEQWEIAVNDPERPDRGPIELGGLRSTRIDTPRLVVEWIVASAVAAIVVWLAWGLSVIRRGASWVVAAASRAHASETRSG